MRSWCSPASCVPMPTPSPDEDAESILGLTHPGQFIGAASHLYKRRGKLTSTVGMKSDWVEQLFVLTDTAICWFDVTPNAFIAGTATPVGAQCGRVDVRHFVSMSVQERLEGVEQGASSSGAGAEGAPMDQQPLTTPSVDELERHGPRHILEIHTITAEQTLFIGSTDRSVIDAWLAVLSRVVGSAGLGLGERLVCPSPLSFKPPAELREALSVELAGVLACGTMQKARGRARAHARTCTRTRTRTRTRTHACTRTHASRRVHSAHARAHCT